MSGSVALRTVNGSDKVVEIIKTHVLYLVTFSRTACHLGDNVINMAEQMKI
jgi:hypothetical protein